MIYGMNDIVNFKAEFTQKHPKTILFMEPNKKIAILQLNENSLLAEWHIFLLCSITR
jgi:hypothetical protein